MDFLLGAIVTLVIVGAVLYVLKQPWVPLDATVKEMIRVLVLIVLGIWVFLLCVQFILSLFGHSGIELFPLRYKRL